MKKIGTLLVLSLLVAFTLPACKGRGSVLAKVGSETITEGDLDLLTRVNPRLAPRLATPAGKEKIVENYVEQELMYLESKKRGLENTEAVKDKLKLYEKIIIAQALMDQELDKRVREYYDNHKDEFERLKLSHILIKVGPLETKPPVKGKNVASASKTRSEPEALKLVSQVQQRLAKGEDFAKVAKEVSDDERTKSAEGDLGYVTVRDKRLERWGWLNLAEKAFSMKAGEVSDPVKTADGFHLLKVTEEKKSQPLEEADAGIRFRLQADIRGDLLTDLKKKYKVEYMMAKTEQPAPMPPAAVPGAPEAPSPQPSAGSEQPKK